MFGNLGMYFKFNVEKLSSIHNFPFWLSPLKFSSEKAYPEIGMYKL
jgi:hypothetical protein